MSTASSAALGGGRSKRLSEGAGGSDGFATAVGPEKLPGSLGEHAADFAALALHAGDLHGVIPRRLVPQPRDHRGLGAALDRDPLRAGHRAAAHGRGMRGDSAGELLGNPSMPSVKREKSHDRCRKIFDVIGLFGFAALRVGLAATCIRGCGTLCGEVVAEPLNGFPRCPHATRE